MTDAQAPAAASIQPLGNYLLLKRLAAGGMAEIYLARHIGIEGFNRLVVVKRIHQHMAEDRHFVQMFFDEARIAARLSHPNIVQIYDLGRVCGYPFIAMEYVQGVSLREVQQRCEEMGKLMPWPLVAWLGARAAEGLAHAHALVDEQGRPAGLVHRDISPQNLLISFEGTLKLVDFGIARASIRVEQTQSFSRKGKLRYMSPEQVLGLPLDARSDLFSLAVVLWELLAGRRLFDAEGELGVMQQITGKPVPEPVRPDETVSPAVCLAIMRALAREPEDRFACAGEMAEVLEASLAEAPARPTARQLHDFLGGSFAAEMQEARSEATHLLALDVTQAASSLATARQEATIEPTVPITGGLGLRVPGQAASFGHHSPGMRALALSVMGGALVAALVFAAVLVPLFRERAAPSAPSTRVEPGAPATSTPSMPSGVDASAPATPLPAGVSGSAPAPGVGSAARSVPAVATSDSGANQGQVTKPAARPKPRGAKPGFLSFDTRPWSQVFLGAQPLGETPLVGVRVLPGKHKLKVMLQGRSPAREVEVVIREGEWTRLTMNL